jgi:hypothetical protein
LKVRALKAAGVDAYGRAVDLGLLYQKTPVQPSPSVLLRFFVVEPPPAARFIVNWPVVSLDVNLEG